MNLAHEANVRLARNPIPTQEAAGAGPSNSQNEMEFEISTDSRCRSPRRRACHGTERRHPRAFLPMAPGLRRGDRGSRWVLRQPASPGWPSIGTAANLKIDSLADRAPVW